MNLVNSIAAGSAIALGLVVCGILLLALGRPIIAKWGLRNIPRRPLQSVLIMVGLTLSTIIFAAALSLGDSLNHSIRRQVIDAYGHIDQVLVPPFMLNLVEQVGDVDLGLDDEGDDQGIVSLLTGLAEGDVESIQDLANDGLPGIWQYQYQDLRNQLAEEKLVDGIAGAIVFPTIIRNLTSGQGEPLGLIFAVDQNYETEFGLHDVRDKPVHISDLEPGVGNVFPFVVGNSINLLAQLAGFAEEVTAAANESPEDVDDALGALVALGALLLEMEGDTFTLNDLRIDVATLRQMGLDTAILEQSGLDELSLQSLGIGADDPVLNALGVNPDEMLRMPSLSDFGLQLPENSNIFSQLNLATLGRDTDLALNQVGLQLHQGDVYLSELGAQQLDAAVGDQLEFFIGPIPVTYRVRGIVKEAGPLGVLIPVVMMDVAEAQRLLFMSERVNTILISNQGDQSTGIQHTETVNQRLRAHALDDEEFDRLWFLLDSPEVASVIQAAAPTARNPFGADEDMPEFMMGIVDSLVGSANFENDVEVLAHFTSDTAPESPDELASEDDDLLLRVALGNPAIREWLQELPLPESDAQSLRQSLSIIDEYLVLSPLSKKLALQGADIAGISFGTVFSISGTLSVLAGMILIFLIFIMLAAERRRELGVMRAVGMRRNHLVQMFVTEGLVYDVAAALLGLGVGLLVAYGMIGFLSGLFADVNRQLGARSSLLTMQWAVAPASIVIAYCLGVLLTWVVVTLSAWRVSRMTIVAAIRDLPSTTRNRSRNQVSIAVLWVVGLGLLSGGIYLWIAFRDSEQTLVLIGATTILLGLAVIGNRILIYTSLSTLGRQQIVHVVTGLGAICIWAIPWNGTSFETVTDQEPFLLLLSFVLSSPLILVGAILVIMGTSDLIARGALHLGGLVGTLAPAIRIAVAYPLSQRFRTGVAMMLFAMVVLTVVVMTYVIRATEILATPSREHTAGFDIILTPGLLSVFDPVFDLETELQSIPDFPAENVAAMGSSSHLRVQLNRQSSSSQHTTWEWDGDILGMDAGYATQAGQVYGFVHKAPEYDTDAEVWQALATRDDVAVVRDLYFLQEELADVDEGRESDLAAAFLELKSTASGSLRTATVQVIGVLEEGESLSYDEFQVNRRVLDYLRGQPIAPDNHYVAVAPGADARETARTLEKGLLSSGVNVQLFADRFMAGQAIVRSILQVFRGFAALGLVVGLAGLAVISSRSVVERRQQVGMLRAIGYRPFTIGLIFVLEASFIALAGICMGVATGMVMGDKMIAQFYEFATELAFPVPWWPILSIFAMTYAFALLAALLPAWQASRIYPAEALRYD